MGDVTVKIQGQVNSGTVPKPALVNLARALGAGQNYKNYMGGK